MTSFAELFAQAFGGASRKPYPYQERLAVDDTLPNLVNVPTGLGKTAAIILGWLFRRRFQAQPQIRNASPRRLVYCLPMRVLVEQTYAEAIRWLDRLGLLAGKVTWENVGGNDLPTRKSQLSRYEPDPADLREPGWAKQQGDQGTDRIAVHLLMGGEEKTDWALWPERDAILIGTQDMLLSRALNRGYAASRARWPVELGLLNNDCLWVFDEVQLMGSGLATTAQLEAFAKRLWKPARPSHFLWMSATLGTTALHTRDRQDWGMTDTTECGLSKTELVEPAVQKRLKADKTLHFIKDRPKASKILESHPRGRISLVILNTVPAAKATYEELRHEIENAADAKKGDVSQPGICLLHSRFRPMDRERQMQQLLDFLGKADDAGAVTNSDGMIVVSTQVIEAGFDLSAARLWSEIAPWPSVLQRLGRLNREGAQPEASASFWMPKADESNKGDSSPNVKRIGPYAKNALDAGKRLLEALIEKQADGSTYRVALDMALATTESQQTFHVEPNVVIRPDDFFELFSTEADLAGGFTNVSQFVRDQDRDADVYVFWRDFDPAKVSTPNELAPAREELCPVPFFEFRQFVGKTRIAWEWNFEAGRWESRRADGIQPGMTLLLPKSVGGYCTDVGWTGNRKDRDFDVLPGSSDDDSLDADFLSGSRDWVSLADHLADVTAEIRDIVQRIELQSTAFGNALLTAARWHDWGKSVDEWQAAVHEYIEQASETLDGAAAMSKLPHFAEVAVEWRDRLRSKTGSDELWAKFPDLRAACIDRRLTLSDTERSTLGRKLKVPFLPRLRHEAASALVAWQSWLAKRDGLTALAVYLIACHHGKVRTVLRSTRGTENVFGITDEMSLRPVLGFFPDQAQLQTNAKCLGACGEWDETAMTFAITSPSWLQMVDELLGPAGDGERVTVEVIPNDEPRELGPLALAYLEALLRAADVRASRQPGKGRAS